jgi:hypothetical protein
LFVIFSTIYVEIACLAVFVLYQDMSEGGSRETVPPGNEPFSKKEMPA